MEGEKKKNRRHLLGDLEKGTERRFFNPPIKPSQCQNRVFFVVKSAHQIRNKQSSKNKTPATKVKGWKTSPNEKKELTKKPEKGKKVVS